MMKVSVNLLLLAAVAVLSPLVVNGECFYEEDFKSSTLPNAVIKSGRFDFAVEKGQTATCTLSCTEGAKTRLAMRFNGDATGTCIPVPSDANCDDGDRYYTSCNFETKTRAAAERSNSLGYRFVVNGPYTNLKMTCTCSGSYDSQSDGILGAGCFSASTIVYEQNKGKVLMKDLKIGDRVLTAAGRNTYESVYSFGHKHEEMEGEFYQIYTTSNNSTMPSLEVTGTHLVFVDNESGSPRAIRADHIQKGDRLVGVGAPVVTKITKITKEGLYMPLTAHGTILVGSGDNNTGIVASTYVSIQDDAPTIIHDIAKFFGLSEHYLSHWWLSPYRMMCMGVSTTFCSTNHDNNTSGSTNEEDEGILNWLLAGRDLAKFAEPLGFTTSIIVLGVPIFVIFAILNVLESLLGGPTWAPLLVASIGLGVSVGLGTLRRNMKTPNVAMKKKTI